MFAAATAWPGCGRSACRCGAKTLSEPSRPSTLIAAATSASTSSRSRSVNARTSCPSMPSVPLISARPFLLGQDHRLEAVRAQRLRGGNELAVGGADVPLAHDGERDVRQRGEVPGTAEAAVLVDHRRQSCREQSRVGLGELGTHPGAAGGQGREPQQHHRADDLALDLGSIPGGMGANQAALQLGSKLERDVPGGQRTETGGDAVHRGRVVGELLDARAARGDRAERVVGDRHGGAMARHAYDVLEGDRADPHDDGILVPLGRVLGRR